MPFSLEWVSLLSEQEFFAELTEWRLAPGLALLALLLGVAAATDIAGKIIPRRVSDPMLAGAIAVAPLLHVELKTVAIALVITNVVCLPMTLAGWMGGADLKLYNVFALILGAGVLPLIVISSFVAALWVLPVRARHGLRRKRDASGKKIEVSAPMAPAICVGLLGTLAAAGMDALQVGALALVMLAGYGYGRFLQPKLDALEERVRREEEEKLALTAQAAAEQAEPAAGEG